MGFNKFSRPERYRINDSDEHGLYLPHYRSYQFISDSMAFLDDWLLWLLCAIKWANRKNWKKKYNWIAQNKRVTSRSRAYEGDMEKSSSQSKIKLPSVKHKQMHEIWAPTRICLLWSALFYHIFAVLFVDITTIATIAVYSLEICRHIKREWKENIHCFIAIATKFPKVLVHEKQLDYNWLLWVSVRKSFLS